MIVNIPLYFEIILFHESEAVVGMQHWQIWVGVQTTTADDISSMAIVS